MPSPAGQRPAASNTVRLTGKKAHGEPERAMIRRTTSALAQMTGSSIKTARQQVYAWLAGGAIDSDIDAWLRQNFRMDPTGVTAVRNAYRGGGRAPH